MSKDLTLAALVFVCCCNHPGGGAIALSADNFASPAEIGSLTPAAGKYFFTLTLTLKSVSAATPVPVDPSYFALGTTEGLSLAPSGETNVLGQACTAGVSVMSQAQYSCALAFQIPDADAPAALHYAGGGSSASTELTYTRPTVPSCQQLAGWHSANKTDCQKCLQAAASSGGACSSQNSAFNQCAAAAGDCVAFSCPTSSDAEKNCDCWTNCYAQASCDSQFQALDDCRVAVCASMCP